MNFLILTLNAWNSTSSTGNTISNLFSKMKKSDDIANIYCRNEIIDNSLCKKYFRVTEKDILHHLLSPNHCGLEINKYGTDVTEYSSNGLIHSCKYDFLRKHRFVFLLLIREAIWLIPVWKNMRLRSFLSDFRPDIIYMHGHNNLYMHRLLDYCAKKTNAKIVLFWGDDMYGRKSRMPLAYIYESMLRKQYRKSINNASLLFGGSIKLCNEYSSIFAKPFFPLFKECKKVGYDKDKIVDFPLTIVYAGNLLFGREKVMMEFVKIVSYLNASGLDSRFIFKIYSNTNPSSKFLSLLSNSKGTFFKGKKSYDEICKEMDSADLVLFIESFDKKNIRMTRLSFSTKIIDYMQSTSAILAVGPSEIASIDYLSKNSIGFIIHDMSVMESKMKYLAEHPEIIYKLNQRKAEFATKYHTNTSTKALAQIRRINYEESNNCTE